MIEKGNAYANPPTKFQNLKRAGDDISEMLSELKSVHDERRSMASNKRVSIESMDKLNKARVTEKQNKNGLSLSSARFTKKSKIGR